MLRATPPIDNDTVPGEVELELARSVLARDEISTAAEPRMSTFAGG
jgi:hypothetical protein